tara:strand:+ start:94 stop:441 length:348 start_codon:yes stop_codon:yes gene_type:complete
MSDSDYIDLNNYPELIDDYIYIEDEKNLEDINNGVYIKYINNKLELRQGGILTNIVNENGSYYLILLQKKYNKCYKVSFNKNYIFQKKNKNDMIRELFLKYYDKYDTDKKSEKDS